MDASNRKAADAEAHDVVNMEKLPYYVTHGTKEQSSPILDRQTNRPKQHVRGLRFWTLLVLTAYLLLMASLRLYYWLGLGLVPLSAPLVLNNEVGRLPALGWNSWNAFHCDIHEDKFLVAAEKLVELGLKDAGYEYVNIDDCWQVRDRRDPDTQRLIPDPVKFPKGIKGTADRVHELGLKIGIYSSAGVETCAHYVASLEYEMIDARTWAEWGIDYLKYDNCGVLTDQWRDECRGCRPDERSDLLANGTCPETDEMCPKDYNYYNSKTALRYRIMRDALAAQNRTILYSICEWGEAGVQQWGNATGSSWRMSGDIFPEWHRILEILNQNSFYLNNVDFWGHSDADMLEVGNGNLTPQESRTHFALWAAMKSPLLIGCDLATVKPWEVDILKNKYLLAFNQDKVWGKPAMPYKWGTNADWTFNNTFPAEYWSGGSSVGTLVLMFNPYSEGRVMRAVWGEVPQLKGGSAEMGVRCAGAGEREVTVRGGKRTEGGSEQLWYHVIDVWSGKDLGCVAEEMKVEVEGHDTAAFLVTGKCVPMASRKA